MRYEAPRAKPTRQTGRGMTRFQIFAIFGSLTTALSLIALSHWQEIQKIAYDLRVSVPAKEQAEALNALEKAAERSAQTGSMEEFERARVEQAAHLLQGGYRPGSSAALYFYPETLPVYSLEREFSNQTLRPGIDALRSAFENRQPASTREAYTVLESRVLSYEGGASARPDLLSPEGRAFLKAYGHFRIAPVNPRSR